MREIGGEFWNVPLTEKDNGIFPEKTQWFMTGRSALSAIAKSVKKNNNVKSIGVPSWCCDSMVVPFLSEGIKVIYYPVTVEGCLVQDPYKSMECDAILMMDYFGYSNSFDADGYGGVVIRDLTHSIFRKVDVSKDNADYYFGSLRKWCGILTGGFAFGNNDHLEKESINEEYLHLRKTAIECKNRYISEETDSKEFLDIFKEAENILDIETNVCGVPESEENIARHIDVQKIREKRKRNAKILLDNMDDSISLLFPEMTEEDCPLFVPVLSDRRTEIRAYLIRNNVYCPVHWPVSRYHVLDDKERFIYDNELSIVCDQRYNEKDMTRICNLIKRLCDDKSI